MFISRSDVIAVFQPFVPSTCLAFEHLPPSSIHLCRLASILLLIYGELSRDSSSALSITMSRSQAATFSGMDDALGDGNFGDEG
jgi:hypothetical protein